MMEATQKDGRPDWTARHNAVMSYAKLIGELTVDRKKNDKEVEEEAGDLDLSKLKGKELVDARTAILESMKFEK